MRGHKEEHKTKLKVFETSILGKIDGVTRHDRRPQASELSGIVRIKAVRDMTYKFIWTLNPAQLIDGEDGSPRANLAILRKKRDVRRLIKALSVWWGCRLGCNRWGAHWRNLANTMERPCAAAMRPYVKLL